MKEFLPSQLSHQEPFLRLYASLWPKSTNSRLVCGRFYSFAYLRLLLLLFSFAFFFKLLKAKYLLSHLPKTSHMIPSWLMTYKSMFATDLRESVCFADTGIAYSFSLPYNVFHFLYTFRNSTGMVDALAVILYPWNKNQDNYRRIH